MSGIVVHSVTGSPYGRAVLATLHEKNVPFRFAPMGPGDSKKPPHLARHPFGRVPAIEHDGFPLYETQAILRYLDRTFSQPGLTPTQAKAAARMDQVMNITDWYVHQGVNNVIGFHRIVGPRLLGLTPNEAAIAEAMPKAHTVFTELSRLLGTQTYFTGDQVSLADIHVGTHLDFMSATPEWAPLTAERPNLVAWLERMRARPSFQATTWEKVIELAKAA
jgi:glutathione S-transferase